MKRIQNTLFVLLWITLLFAQKGIAQVDALEKIEYEIKRVYPRLTISKQKLDNAHILSDLNERYKTSWVRKYIGVDIHTIHQGKIKNTHSPNDVLTKEQKDHMQSADTGSKIVVMVEYIPENTLTSNEVKVMEFDFVVDADRAASYTGGSQLLNQYLKQNAIDKIPSGTFKNYDMTAIQFSIDHEGQIVDAQVFDPSYFPNIDNKVDQLLLETICNMPIWQPAAYANGIRVKQDFVLTVGNMENCVINLLNVNQD